MAVSFAPRVLAFIAVLACMLMAGCAVGPDFKRPVAPADSGYTKQPLATTVTSTNVTGGESQNFIEGRDLTGDWWTLFHSEALNELIQLSLTNNPDLKAAQDALLVAHGKYPVATGRLLSQCHGKFFGHAPERPAGDARARAQFKRVSI